MSKLISDILGAPEPQFTHNLKDWEKLSGNQAHDLRLISDITAKNRRMLAELNLDISDTSAKELYYALKHRAISDSEALEKYLKINSQASGADMLKAAVELVESLAVPREVWVLKQSAAKQLIKANSPKKLLKALGLRSIDSALKRINPYELLGLSREIETPEWSSKMHSALKKMRPPDFVAAKSSIVIVSENRRKKLQASGFRSPSMVKPMYETGVVFVLPASSRYKGDVLSVILALLQSLTDLRIYSAYFRHISTKPDFGIKLFNSVRYGLPGASVNSASINWSILQKHLSASDDAFESIKQPHLEKDDINTPRALELFALVLPQLEFWRDFDLAISQKGESPTSSHLLDVIANVINDLEYERGSITYMQSRLWEELCLRYLQGSAVEAQAIEQLSSN